MTLRLNRTAPDACPGVLRPHLAADGALVRLRLPGGRVTGAALRVLAALAEDHGDGALHLTSRAGVQLRGLSLQGGEVPSVVLHAVRDVGLLPVPTHERVRNLLASPLGADGVLREVDRAVLAEPALVELPGRFLVALDDGTGDVAGSIADVGWLARPDGAGVLLLAGRDTGLRVTAGRVAPVVVAAALAFVAHRRDTRSTAWRVAELPGAVEAMCRAAVGVGAHDGAAPEPVPAAADRLPSLGRLPQPDGRWAAAALVPLGRLDAATARRVADLAGDGGLVVTPWRELVVRDLDRRAAGGAVTALAAAGLVVDPGSPWRGVSACAGRPGCAKAELDVRLLAHQLVGLGEPDGERLHLSGCARRCGHPPGPHRELVGTAHGLLDRRTDPGTRPDGQSFEPPRRA